MPTMIHTADLHLGAKFEFLPEELIPAAQKLQTDALRSLIQYTADSQADVLLIAGDVFDAPEVPAQLASAVFEILSECPCPVFIAPGNHDYYFSKSPYALQPIPSNVCVFTSRELKPIGLPDGKTVIWGAAFQDNKADIPLEAELDASKINICLVHGELGGTGGYNSISESAVLTSGFDYIALGHNHRFSGVFRIGNTALSCPGCFSATASNETGIKGFLTGEIEKGSVSLRMRASGALEFADVSVSMNGLHSDEMLASALVPLLPTPAARYCCHVHLVGTKQYAPNLTALTRSLRNNYFHAIVTDESAEEQDLFRYQKDEGLRGTVTRDFMEQLEKHKDNEQESAKLMLALEYAIAALDGREVE